MKIILLEVQTSEELGIKNLKADELSVALQCRHITFGNQKFLVIRSEMVVPNYSPIADSTPYVEIYVEEVK